MSSSASQADITSENATFFWTTVVLGEARRGGDAAGLVFAVPCRSPLT